MCEGEFESLQAVHAVSPSFVPRPIAWGTSKTTVPETYFLLAEFRNVGEQVSPFLLVLRQHILGISLSSEEAINCGASSIYTSHLPIPSVWIQQPLMTFEKASRA